MLAPKINQKHEVLCSITTAGDVATPPMDWRRAIPATFDLSLNRLSIFLTTIGYQERQEFYALLRERQRRGAIVIPFVHARSDMLPDEYRMLMAEFGTERFNLHPVRLMPLPSGGLPEDLCARTYIENIYGLLESDLQGFAGICLDVSHLELTRRLHPEQYPELCRLAETYPIGANHISAYPAEKPDGKKSEEQHRYSSLSDFDYLDRYPLAFFGQYVAIELTNELSEQLPVKALLERHLSIV